MKRLFCFGIAALLSLQATAGQACIAKMPIVRQGSVALTQERLAPWMQRVRGEMKKTMEAARAAP